MPLHKFFIFTIFLLAAFGLIMVASASGFQAQVFFGDTSHLFLRQLFYGFLAGICGFIIGYFIKLSLLQKLTLPLLIISIILLVLVFLPGFGFKHAGSHRWLDIGPISVQPSEIAKLALLFYGARWLASHKKELTNFSQGFLPFLVVALPIPILILLEPNISNFGISAFLIFVLLILAGARLSHIALLALVGSFLLLLAVLIFPTRLGRVLTFLNPTNDPSGSSYQINQSLIAIGSGGLWGRGLGQSIQKHGLLPEPSGDAIFAVIAEELGFVGSAFLVGLYLLLLVEGIIISSRTYDLFSQYVTLGFVALVSLQAFINISAVSGLLPLTGITLPFISYGSSSLASLLTASGVIAAIAKRSS